MNCLYRTGAALHMRFRRRLFVAFCGVLPLFSCGSVEADPHTRVLGFATDCHGGATALITEFRTHPEQDAHPLKIDEASLQNGQATLQIFRQWQQPRAPFVVAVNQFTDCVFPSSKPVHVLEARCYSHGDDHALCKARLNFQGLRPAPQGHATTEYPDHLAYGAYPATQPHALFDEPDLARANDLERARVARDIVHPL